MNSFRKWFYRPRRDDTSLMAQFYYADEELNLVAGELDSFDGRKDPERCTALVNQLRQAQDKVLNICVEMMEDLLPDERAPRDFRVKFPDDVMQETLSGQLWFGAECLAAGSSILNREAESTKMRPLAKAVTKTIENVRNLLREQCLKPLPEYTEKIRESLKIFDRLFADFELSYVSAMVPVKSVEEYEMQQNVVVLFSDTLQRSVKIGIVSQEQVDNYDPALMFTIPRLAIVAGLVIFPEGPLNVEKESKNLSELFRPFKMLLLKIRELLWTMSPQELATLEKCLCSMEEPDISIQNLQRESPLMTPVYHGPVAYTSDFVHRFYANYPSCRQLTPDMISLCSVGKKSDKNDRKRERNSSKSSRTRARQERQNERFLSRLTGVEERPRARRRSRRSSQNSSSSQVPENTPDRGTTPARGNASSYDPMVRQTQQITSRSTRGRSMHSSSVIANVDRPYPQVSSRPHSRQSCHTSRHRAGRINTIVCACGTTNQIPPNSSERYDPTLQMDENFQRSETTYAVDDCPYSSSSAYPLYRTENAEVSEYPEHSSYDYLDNYDSSLNVLPVAQTEPVPDSMELARPANIQNCVTNAVIADPCILFPVSYFDEENNLRESTNSPPTEPELFWSDFSNLGIVDETLDPSRINCDDCNNVQSYSCDNTSNTNTITCDKQMDNSLEENGYDLDGNETTTENGRVDANNESSPSTMSEPSSPHSTLKPFGRKIPLHMHSNETEKDTSGFLDKTKGAITPTSNPKVLHTPYDIDKPEGGNGDVGSSGSTSPHHSGTEDDEEVALALQAAEVAASWKARERFADSGDLIQRLFVCISGVADQLQTNYASDMRKILRSVFTMNQTPDEEEVEILEGKEHLLLRREAMNEDGTSTSGSEQLSVGSAEDALAAIDVAEVGGQPVTPRDPSDGEEEGEGSSCHSDTPGPRSLRRANSVIVPASVFNDHSLMQYSSMSPPPPVSNRSFGAAIESTEMVSDNDSPGDEASLNDVPNGHRIRYILNTIPENATTHIPATATDPFSVSVASMISVASSSVPANAVELGGGSSIHALAPLSDSQEGTNRRYSIVQEPPMWIPDNLAPRCMACGALFTVVRRRHHCRNCGKVFCGHCSRHSVPLPHFGIWKNVRVCNACFLYYVTSSADGSSALS